MREQYGDHFNLNWPQPVFNQMASFLPSSSLFFSHLSEMSTFSFLSVGWLLSRGVPGCFMPGHLLTQAVWQPAKWALISMLNSPRTILDCCSVWTSSSVSLGLLSSGFIQRHFLIPWPDYLVCVCSVATLCSLWGLEVCSFILLFIAPPSLVFSLSASLPLSPEGVPVNKFIVALWRILQTRYRWLTSTA